MNGFLFSPKITASFLENLKWHIACSIEKAASTSLSQMKLSLMLKTAVVEPEKESPPMETASIVLDHKIDPQLVEEIESLRIIRLSLAEKLLQDFQGTVSELKSRGLIDDEATSEDLVEIRSGLNEKVVRLRERSANKGVVFLDEIELYMNLIDNDEEEAQAAE